MNGEKAVSYTHLRVIVVHKGIGVCVQPGDGLLLGGRPLIDRGFHQIQRFAPACLLYTSDYKEINHGNLILLADFYGVSLDYLFCRTENRAEINTPLRELHLSDVRHTIKSTRIFWCGIIPRLTCNRSWSPYGRASVSQKKHKNMQQNA